MYLEISILDFRVMLDIPEEEVPGGPYSDLNTKLLAVLHQAYYCPASDVIDTGRQ